jgi:hypothetical protein
VISIFTRKGRLRLRIGALELLAGRGLYPAEHRLEVIRETGADLPSHLAWKALRRLREKRLLISAEI